MSGNEIMPVFSGEVMLAGWKESHNGGATVTFWLPDPAELDVFRGMTARKGNTAGQRFMAVLVEVGEDERPATSTNPIGPLCMLAVQWCQDVTFQGWMCDQFEPIYEKHLGEDLTKSTATVMREVCEVESRRMFDDDPRAARRFDELIRQPYMAHLRAKQ